MSKKAGRKKQFARRATALLLSLAMVFSVIYLNNRDQVAEADPLAGIVTFDGYTDEHFLADKTVSDFSATGADKKEIKVYSPTDQVKFTLPDPSSLNDPSAGVTYVWADYSAQPKVDDTTPGTSDWQIIAGTNVSVLGDTVKKVALFKLTAGTEDPFVAAQVEEAASLELVVGEPNELSAAANATEKKIKIAGTDLYEDNDDTDTAYYYGKSYYAYDTETTLKTVDQISEWKESKSDILTEVNKADGTYNIYKKVELRGSNGAPGAPATTLCYFLGVTVTRDFDLTLGSNLVTLSDGTMTATMDPDSKIVELTNVDPSKVVTLTFDTAEAITSITAVNKDDNTDTYSSTGKTTLTFPKNTNNEGKNREYTVTAKSRNADHANRNDYVLTAKISYISANPVISGLGVEAKGTDKTLDGSGACYINAEEEKSAYIKAHIEVTNDIVTLQRAELREVISGMVSPTASATVNLSNKQEDVRFAYDPTVAEIKEYKIWAKSTSDGGITISDKSVILKYDPSAPTITNMKVVQDSVSQNVTDGGQAANALTVSKGLSFEATVKDATNAASLESGLDTVTVAIDNGTAKAATVSGTDMSFSVSAAEAAAYQGRTVPVKITAKDVAGNVATAEFRIEFLAESIEITHEIQEMSKRVDEGNKIYTPDGAFKIIYTFVADADLTGATLTLTQDDGTETTKPITAAQLGTPTKSGNQRTYTYEYEVSESVSTALKQITMTAENEHGYTADQPDIITFIGIDLSPSGYTYDSSEQEGYITNGTWRRSLVMKVNFTDPEAGDPLAGKFQTGFSSTQEDTLKNVTGATVKEFKIKSDGLSGFAVFEVKPSTSTAGTKVSFDVYDKVGHKMSYSETIYIDKTAPEIKSIKVNGMESPKKLAGDPKITVKSTDNIKINDATMMIRKPDGSIVDVSAKLSSGSLAETKLSDLLGSKPADGTYKITVKVADLPLDNVASPKISETVPSKSVSFIVDNAPPVVSATIRNAKDIIRNGKYTNEENVGVILTVSDANVAEKNIFVTLDGKAQSVEWTENGNSRRGILTVSGEGSHTVKINATDDAGNKAKQKSVTFVIDTTDPEVTTELDGNAYDPGDLWYRTKGAAITLSVYDVNKDPYGITTTIKERPNDGSMATTDIIENDKEGTVKYSDDSRYTITYDVVDLAGNETSRTIVFVVDTTRPTNDIIIRDPENAAKFKQFNSKYSNAATGEEYQYANYFNHNVDMDFVVEDGYISSVTVTDNGEVVKRRSDFTTEAGMLTASYKATTEGVHNIVIVSEDKAENVSVTKTVSFVIDKTNPVLSTTLNGTTFSEGAATRYLTSDGTVAVTVSDVNKDESDLTKTQKIMPPNSAETSAVVKVREGSEDFTTEADYEIAYQAVDRAGNKSATRTVTFRVDKTAPQLQISGTTEGGTSTTSVVASYHVIEAFYKDMNSAVVKVYKKIDGSSESLLRQVDFKATGPDSTMSETFADDGEYRFEFDAEDKAGNTAHTSYTFLVDATAPTLVLGGVKNYEKTKTDVELDVLVTENFYTTNTITIEGVRQDIDGKKTPVEIQPFNAHSGREVNIKQLFKEDGIYDVTVTTKDKAGNESKQAVHFTIDKTKPVIGELPQYTEQTLNKFDWDVDENALVRDLTVCDVTIYLDGVAYDGMADLSDGAHTLRVDAVDELKNEDAREYSFSLDAIAPTIIISGIEDNQIVEEPVDIRVSLQINDDILDQVSLNGAAQTIKDNAASFKIDQEGDYTLEVKAHDSANNESSTKLTFTYGKKSSWWWIAAVGGGVLLLLIILLIIRRKSWSKK